MGKARAESERAGGPRRFVSRDLHAGELAPLSGAIRHAAAASIAEGRDRDAAEERRDNARDAEVRTGRQRDWGSGVYGW